MAFIGRPAALMHVGYPHTAVPGTDTLNPRPSCATGTRAKAPQPGTSMIEPLRPGDGPRLRALRVQALKESPDAFGSTVADALRRTDTDWEEQVANLPTFVWSENDADMEMVRVAPHMEDGRAGYLISLWVAPGARGRGIGAALANATSGWWQ
jgi:GNAT superfamily N-acetyltransferase